MDIQWVPYSHTKDFWTEFELLFRDTQKEEGYSCIDVYYLLEDVILVYSKLMSLAYKIPLQEALKEMFKKNSTMFESLGKNMQQGQRSFTNSGLENFLEEFYVPTELI